MRELYCLATGEENFPARMCQSKGRHIISKYYQVREIIMNELEFCSELKKKLLVDPDDALVFIYVGIDKLLRDGDFNKVDKILTACAAEPFSTMEFLALLSITYSAKDKLKHRSEFAKHVRNHIIGTGSKYADELLSGLE